MTLISKEKRKNHVSGSSQVYGGATPEKATEIGRFKNAACTSVLIVADLFTAVPEKSGRIGARP